MTIVKTKKCPDCGATMVATCPSCGGKGYVRP